MLENLALNRVKNVLPLLADAARLSGILPRGFDRAVMNLPFGGVGFLGTALSLCRRGGIIHLYAMESEEGSLVPSLQEKGCEILGERVVHTYSPSEWLAVYDLRVR
jgi:tRNA (guanine37-N1)-methyltransferase